MFVELYEVYLHGVLIARASPAEVPKIQSMFLCFVDDQSRTVVLLG